MPVTRNFLKRDPEPYHCNTVRFSLLYLLDANWKVGIITVIGGVSAVAARCSEGSHPLGGFSYADGGAIEQLRSERGERRESCLQSMEEEEGQQQIDQ